MGESPQSQAGRGFAVIPRGRKIVISGVARPSLRYAASHPVRPCIIPGAKSLAQAEANARAGEEAMSEAEREALAALVG